MVLGNAPTRAVATLRPNGRPTEKEFLLIAPVRASATFSLSSRHRGKRRSSLSFRSAFPWLPYDGYQLG